MMCIRKKVVHVLVVEHGLIATELFRKSDELFTKSNKAEALN